MEIAAGIIFAGTRALTKYVNEIGNEKEEQYMICILCTAFSFAIKVFCHQSFFIKVLLPSKEMEELHFVL